MEVQQFGAATQRLDTIKRFLDARDLTNVFNTKDLNDPAIGQQGSGEHTLATNAAKQQQ
jgi:hypothetical protein